jgi:lysophospholipase L1-like esterase
VTLKELSSIHALTPIRIVAIGDSTTAGTPGFLSPLEAPPAGRGDLTSQYAWWLMKARPGWDVLNRGVNGERSDQIRARFARDVLEAAPEVAVIIAGVNDVYQGRSSDHVIEQLRAMYTSALEAEIPIVAGSIIPFNTATPEQNARMREVNEWIESSASRAANIAFADTRKAVASRNDPDVLSSSPDELHPSPDGYRLMAEVLLPAIDRLLASGS